MKKILLIICLALTICSTAIASPRNELPDCINHPNTVLASGVIQVSFSPEGGCEGAIINEINNATKSIDIQAYSFTSKGIGQALIRAAERGVSIRVIADKSQEQHKYSLCNIIAANNIPIKIDHDFAIAHNKIIVINKSTVITGSFNFSAGAEHKNAENLLIIRGDQALADLYMKNFEWRWRYADDYVISKTI